MARIPGSYPSAGRENTARIVRSCWWAMTTWTAFVDEAPELADRVWARFAATKHHVLATLRADGSPRVSGTEVARFGDDLVIGSMWEARKAFDLRRDPRFALHANPGDPSMEGGDAKIAGVAVEVLDEDVKRAFLDGEFPADEPRPPEPYHLFRLDLTEAVLTEPSADQGYLGVQVWHPGRGVVLHKRT